MCARECCCYVFRANSFLFWQMCALSIMFFKWCAVFSHIVIKYKLLFYWWRIFSSSSFWCAMTICSMFIRSDISKMCCLSACVCVCVCKRQVKNRIWLIDVAWCSNIVPSALHLQFLHTTIFIQYELKLTMQSLNEANKIEWEKKFFMPLSSSNLTSQYSTSLTARADGVCISAKEWDRKVNKNAIDI